MVDQLTFASRQLSLRSALVLTAFCCTWCAVLRVACGDGPCWLLASWFVLMPIHFGLSWLVVEASARLWGRRASAATDTMRQA